MAESGLEWQVSMTLKSENYAARSASRLGNNGGR